MLSVFLAACGSSCLLTPIWRYICYCCVFLQKVCFLISEAKRKTYEKDIHLELNSERYIYFFFFIFEILAGRCPPAAVHLQDALT